VDPWNTWMGAHVNVCVCLHTCACAQQTVVTVFISQLNLKWMHFCGIHDDIYFSIVHPHFITTVNNITMWVQCGYLFFKIWCNMIDTLLFYVRSHFNQTITANMVRHGAKRVSYMCLIFITILLQCNKVNYNYNSVISLRMPLQCVHTSGVCLEWHIK
jgi:hypothetical protein